MTCTHEHTSVHSEPFMDQDGKLVKIYYKTCMGCDAHTAAWFKISEAVDDKKLLIMEEWDAEFNSISEIA